MVEKTIFHKINFNFISKFQLHRWNRYY